MWWAMLALLSGSHVDLVNNPAELRVCAAAAELSAQQAERKGVDAFDVKLNRMVAKIYVDRLRELGAGDAAALAAVQKGLGDSPAEMALYDKCQTIVMAMPADGSLLEGAQAADAIASAAGDASAAAAEPEEAVHDGDALLAGLSEPRRGEVRCATIASALMYDVGRGVSDKSYGLTAAGAETLAGRLAEAIMTETGMSEAEVRAAYKADFEEFTAAMLGEEQDEKAALAMVEAGVAQCRPLYDSIDLSGDGDGAVTGLTPAAMLGGAAAPDAAQCYAIMARFLPGMPKESKEAKAFGDIVARLEQRHYADHGQTAEAAADLAAAVAGFDDAAFEALPEAEAETQMGHCMDLAGR
ncbi:MULTISPECIES: hypothetical protein [unclassified Sphingopyxis]|uniref:hypothetical protein n=1 Tax=unclassified Sphingopyxis TaxID=2614943 RepID=UPI000737127B|nr:MULTISPECIES: hypothetical protein [unclassified Sphingopyxis]KTE33488.1 hypothetical protein ATE62_16955 [Sphingopyxis sp. HIX]KTE83707.1 hypothetical protein ATE72_12635 [Sphingopyxis sp. HXXIV]